MPPSLERQCNAPAASVHRDTLGDALQDLVLLVQRDGILLARLGCSQGLGDLYKNPVAFSHPAQLPQSGGITDWRAT